MHEILEQAIENASTDDPEKKVGGMIQMSGLTLRYDPKEGFGHRLKSVVVAGHPLDPQRTYRVVTNSMLAAGGHRDATFLQGQGKEEQGGQYETIKNWMKQEGEVAAPAPGRNSK